MRLVSGWTARATASVAAMRAAPTVTAVAAEGFLTRLGFGMVSLALPLFALSLGMSLAEVGLLTALRTVAVIGIKPIMGWAADRYGRKTTLIIAVLLRCLVGLLFVFASEPWHLYALRILQGAMTAARDPSAAALLATHGKRKSMASTFAWYTTARDVGRSLGYGVAGLLIEFSGGFQAVFLIAFLTSCIAVVTVVKYVSESPDAPPAPAASVAEEPPARPVDAHTNRSLSALWALYGRLLPYAGFGLMVASSAEATPSDSPSDYRSTNRRASPAFRLFLALADQARLFADNLRTSPDTIAKQCRACREAPNVWWEPAYRRGV